LEEFGVVNLDFWWWMQVVFESYGKCRLRVAD